MADNDEFYDPAKGIHQGQTGQEQPPAQAPAQEAAPAAQPPEGEELPRAVSDEQIMEMFTSNMKRIQQEDKDNEGDFTGAGEQVLNDEW